MTYSTFDVAVTPDRNKLVLSSPFDSRTDQFHGTVRHIHRLFHYALDFQHRCPIASYNVARAVLETLDDALTLAGEPSSLTLKRLSDTGDETEGKLEIETMTNNRIKTLEAELAELKGRGFRRAWAVVHSNIPVKTGSHVEIMARKNLRAELFEAFFGEGAEESASSQRTLDLEES